jgi:hypothetical protein
MALLATAGLAAWFFSLRSGGVQVTSVTAARASHLKCDAGESMAASPDKSIEVWVAACKAGTDQAAATALYLHFLDDGADSKPELALVTVGLAPTELRWRPDGRLSVTLPEMSKISGDLTLCTGDTGPLGTACIASSLLVIDLHR